MHSQVRNAVSPHIIARIAKQNKKIQKKILFTQRRFIQNIYEYDKNIESYSKQIFTFLFKYLVA